MTVASSPSSVPADLEAHSGTVASSPSSVVAASVFAVFVSASLVFFISTAYCLLERVHFLYTK
ncbi:hypothetical protein SESBI_25195 [Sesbania bispinosa]|nr:hypothetical protein SESBI_25195 [Sesbania bispinosa]